MTLTTTAMLIAAAIGLLLAVSRVLVWWQRHREEREIMRMVEAAKKRARDVSS